MDRHAVMMTSGLTQPGRFLSGWVRRLFLAVLLTLLGLSAAHAERRVALVIGNSAYQHAAPLRNPVQDASKVSEVLRKLDFDVTTVTNADKIGMERAVRQFAESLSDADVALFYYSGHAVQISDRNYLVPISALLDGAQNTVLDAVALQDISNAMRQAGARVQLLFLDACRNNPFGSALSAPQGFSATRGLAPVQTTSGSLVVFSTAPGQEALDGNSQLSPFTAAFTHFATVPGLEIRQVLSRVRAQVADETGQRQIPWDNSSLLGDMYLVPKRPPPRFDRLARVSLPADSQPWPLRLTPPLQPEGGTVEIAVDHAPTAGTLAVGDRPIRSGDTMTAAEFGTLTYAGTSAAAVDSFSFAVRDAWGNNDLGLVSIARESSAPAPVAAAPPPRRPLQDSEAEAATLIGIGPNLVFKRGLTLPETDRSRLVRLASAVPFGQLVLGDRVIEPGRSIALADVQRLGFIAPAGTAGKRFDATFVPVEDTTGSIRLAVDVALIDCDRLAGDRLDMQGVSEGVLTGQIDVQAALPACENAIRAAPGVARFAYQLGRVYGALGRDADSQAQYRKAAAAGHIRALTALGYHDLYVPPLDLARGKATLERAAGSGDVFAMHILGQMYYEGRGVTKDLAKARGYYETAARMGHTYSMNALGRMYQRGETVPIDLQLTRRYWSESAARGDVYGIDNMGFLYLDGVGVDKNVDTALSYFRRAAELGHPEAPNNIGRMFALGLGVPVDYKEAEKWYAIGADRGDAWAAYNLAQIDRNGLAGAADPVAAGYFYARAAASTNRLEPATLGKAALATLDRKAKAAVLRRLLAEIDPTAAVTSDDAAAALTRKALAARSVTPADGSLDGLIIAAAQAAFMAKNARTDLF